MWLLHQYVIHSRLRLQRAKLPCVFEYGCPLHVLMRVRSCLRAMLSLVQTQDCVDAWLLVQAYFRQETKDLFFGQLFVLIFSKSWSSSNLNWSCIDCCASCWDSVQLFHVVETTREFLARLLSVKRNGGVLRNSSWCSYGSSLCSHRPRSMDAHSQVDSRTQLRIRPLGLFVTE